MVRPDADDDLPFAISAGAVRGLTRGVLAGPRFETPFPGVRQPKGAAARSAVTLKHPHPELLFRARQFAPRLRPGQFFSHATALALYGSPTPRGWSPELHVSAHRPDREPRVEGVEGHRLQERAPGQRRAAGLVVEDPARAWVQAAGAWDDEQLIVAGDFLVARRRRLSTIEELRAEANACRRGRRLGAALDAIRDGSESSEETRLRLALVRARLPEPELNVALYDERGRFVARLDQVFRRYRVAVEYDGRIHAESARQFERDADRWDDIRSQGWDLVRIVRHHMTDGAAAAVEKVAAALRRGGWRP